MASRTRHPHHPNHQHDPAYARYAHPRQNHPHLRPKATEPDHPQTTLPPPRAYPPYDRQRSHPTQNPTAARQSTGQMTTYPGRQRTTGHPDHYQTLRPQPLPRPLPDGPLPARRPLDQPKAHRVQNPTDASTNQPTTTPYRPSTQPTPARRVRDQAPTDQTSPCRATDRQRMAANRQFPQRNPHHPAEN